MTVRRNTTPNRVAAIIVVGLCTLSLASVRSVRAQTYDAYATADSVTVGDRFEIVVSVEHDGNGLVIFPHSFIPDSLRQSEGFSLGDFVFLNESSQGRRRISRGWVLDSLAYEVTTFALDTAYISLLPVGLISGTDTLVAATPPVVVPVQSLVPADAENIRDITDLAEFPASPWIWWIVISLVLAAAAYWYWLRFRKKTEEPDPDAAAEPEDLPWDEAQQRLKQLEDIDLTDPELIKPFYIELSEILRNYLERRTRVPALETSTSELLSRLRSAVENGQVPPAMISEIEAVLSQADLVKFARVKPVSTVGTEAILHTRTAIDETEKEMISFDGRLRTEEAQNEKDETDQNGAVPESEDEDAAVSLAHKQSAFAPGAGSETENVVIHDRDEAKIL